MAVKIIGKNRLKTLIKCKSWTSTTLPFSSQDQMWFPQGSFSWVVVWSQKENNSTFNPTRMFAMYLFSFAGILTPFSWMEAQGPTPKQQNWGQTNQEQKEKILKFQESLLVNLEMHFQQVFFTRNFTEKSLILSCHKWFIYIQPGVVEKTTASSSLEFVH